MRNDQRDKIMYELTKKISFNNTRVYRIKTQQKN